MNWHLWWFDWSDLRSVALDMHEVPATRLPGYLDDPRVAGCTGNLKMAAATLRRQQDGN